MKNEKEIALAHLERCADVAPEGTYEKAKELVAEMNEIIDEVIKRIRAIGLEADGCAGARKLHRELYDYVKFSNIRAGWLVASEGFGEHSFGPAKDRIIEQAIRDRDALKRLGVI